MLGGLIIIFVIGAIIAQFSHYSSENLSQDDRVAIAYRRYENSIKEEAKRLTLKEAVQGKSKSEEYLKAFKKELAQLHYNRLIEDVIAYGKGTSRFYIDTYKVDIEEELLELLEDVDYEIIMEYETVAEELKDELLKPRYRYVRVEKQ